MRNLIITVFLVFSLKTSVFCQNATVSSKCGCDTTFSYHTYFDKNMETITANDDSWTVTFIWDKNEAVINGDVETIQPKLINEFSTSVKMENYTIILFHNKNGYLVGHKITN